MNTSGQGNWMDKMFQKKLSDFEIRPETHVWEGISRKLDQDKRRPGFFGHWWTVLLSILTILMIGIGAYMLLKKSGLNKSDKKQNRDLPYFNDEKTDNGTAYYDFSEFRTIPTIPNSLMGQTTKKAGTSRKYSKSKENVSYSKAHLNNQDLINPVSVLNTSVNSVTESDNTNLINFASLLNDSDGNDLIVSSDSEFYSTKEFNTKSVTNLPLKEMFLQKEQQKELLSAATLEGCNVYRDDKTHFFVDLYYAPEIANRSLSTSRPELQSYVDARANSEKPIISYSAGIKASVVFGNGLSVRGGLSYSSNTERFDFVKETQTIKKEIFDNNGNLVRTEYTELVIMDKTYNKYKYLDIPITVGYEKDLKDFIFSLNGGIGINVSASQSGKIYKDDKNTMSFYSLENNGEANAPIFRSNAGLSLIGSVGLNYKYNERVMLLLEPSARYYVRSLSDPSNPISQNYLYLGLNIGLRYRIK